jgi:hypothetical protein
VSPLRRAACFVAGFALVAGVLAGCSSARTDVGTTDESCYLALPVAAHAIGGHGHLAGVRKYSLNGLKGIAPHLYAYLAPRLPKGQSVCLAAYTGHFTGADVQKPVGRAVGTLAVPVVSVPGKQLYATLILTHIPVRFQHQF